MRRLLAILASVITIGVGLVTIYDLTLGSGIIASSFLRLAVATLAILIVAGVINLLMVHLGRVRQQTRGWVYSIILLLSAIVTLVLWAVGQSEINNVLLNDVQVAIESSMAALTLFALVYGGYRLLHRRASWARALFLLAMILVLLGALPLASTGWFEQVRTWVLQVPVSAGARGILFGIALGTIVTGVRILVGQDRSYRE
jgi:drug/metabolite transporter (DMT)-like permease